MTSLWGSKKQDDDEPVADSRNGESSEHAPAPRLSEADERTRLLPTAPNHNSYLSPDDPAVSPYLIHILCTVISKDICWLVHHLG